jgi:hypothetical protein
MGSRRGRYAPLILLLAAACTSGAPPGFVGGSGDRWSFPLVGPLENGQLVTAVSINTHGPFLFAIDPDAKLSVADAELVKLAGLRTFKGPRLLDETDTQQTRIYAELIGLELGTLIIERRNVVLVRRGTFDAGGRRIMGVLGRDILADSLVFGFDRDHGLAHLMTPRAFEPPANATAISYAPLRSRVTNAEVVPLPRHLVDSRIGTATVELHVDLGSTVSQLRESL